MILAKVSNDLDIAFLKPVWDSATVVNALENHGIKADLLVPLSHMRLGSGCHEFKINFLKWNQRFELISKYGNITNTPEPRNKIRPGVP